jgi:anaerobic magnesium-protoporphyrin IX monomethyl ester cyclase
MNKKKVLLVRPKNLLSYNNYPSLGLVQIGSALDQAGYDVEIFNASNHKDYINQILNKANGALLVGLTVLTPEVKNAIEIAMALKSTNSVPIVWGGWHVTLFSEQFAVSELVDYAIVDEGDTKIVELADVLSKGGKYPNKIIASSNKLDLNGLPHPDYSMITEIENYITRPLSDKFQEKMGHTIRWLPYQASRGCPHNCNFCINVVTGNQQYRTKSPEKVLDEISRIVDEFRLDHLKIIDDNFFVKKAWAQKICESILKRGLKFTWDAECRVDYFRDGFVDDDFLNLLKASGLVQLTLGVESASKNTIKILNKGINVEDTRRAITTLNKHDMVARCSFMVGLPGEGQDDILTTAAFISEFLECPNFEVGVQTYRPYPKSKIADKLEAEGKLSPPKRLEDWCQKQVVSLYTFTDAVRMWTKQGELAMNVSHFYSIASGARLRLHQVPNMFLRWALSTIRRIAVWRTRKKCFSFSADKLIYNLLAPIAFRLMENEECKRTKREK